MTDFLRYLETLNGALSAAMDELSQPVVLFDRLRFLHHWQSMALFSLRMPFQVTRCPKERLL